MDRFSRAARRVLLVAALLVSGCGTTRPRPNRLSALPAVWRATPGTAADRDSIPKPDKRAANVATTWISHSLIDPLLRLADLPLHLRKLAGRLPEAEGRTAFDDVPNSTWFTHRNDLEPLSEGEMRAGPPGDGPPAAGVWSVMSAKTIGVTPGFAIRDGRGDRYLLKFDPPGHPELNSGAEAVVTRLLHSAGYRVPENFVVLFAPTDLVVDSSATVEYSFGHERPFTRRDLDLLLRRLDRTGSGQIRALASRYLPGKPVGPLPYLGRRRDDPNDLIAHQKLRELRGLYAVCAWLNHVDIKESNTLDLYGASGPYVEHALIDFGSALGSGSSRAHTAKDGQAYLLDFGQIALNIATLGLYVHRYERIDSTGSPALGYYDVRDFAPNGWKPQESVPPFSRRTERDGLWGALLVSTFTDRQIRAAVESGRYTDPADGDHLAGQIIARRDKLVRHWFARLAPLTGFESMLGGVRFSDRAVGFGSATTGRYRWRLRGADGRAISDWIETDGDSGGAVELRFPAALAEQIAASAPATVAVEIVTLRPTGALPPVWLYLRAGSGDRPGLVALWRGTRRDRG